MNESELTIEKRWMVLARLHPEDFCRFYENYCDLVYRFCLRRTLDPQVAEDLTSETFLRAQRNLWRFRWQRVTFGAYLYRIALNLVRQHVIRAARSVNVGNPDLTIIDVRLSPLAEIVLTERQRAVRIVVGHLDALSQDIFLLHYWEELTTAEIAAVLDTPEGTVKTRLRRGREVLRLHLRRLGIEPAFADTDGPTRCQDRFMEEAE